MCRSTEDPGLIYHGSRRWRNRIRNDRLNIRAFYLRFSIISFSPLKENPNPIPNSLTLHYLPRISGSPLDINDAPIPSDSPAFLTLHRLTSHSQLGESTTKEFVFTSRERIRASEGVRFEVYWEEEKVLKGVFRRKGSENQDDFTDFIVEWKVDCRCAVESNVVDPGLFEVSHAEVCIETEGDGRRVMMSDKVDMAVGRKKMKKKKKKNRGFVGLEEIPEVTEVDEDNEEVPDGNSSSSSCFSSCCCCGDCGGDLELPCEGGGDAEVSGRCGDGEKQGGLEVEIEGVRLAVDVGIWVMCLGVGFLVSRASSTRFRRRRRSFFF